jgi:hypothetical protein
MTSAPTGPFRVVTEERRTMDIYWPGLVVLFYALIGLGYTIIGIYALSDWRQKRRDAKEDAKAPVS